MPYATLVQSLWPTTSPATATASRPWVRQLALVLLGSALVGLSAQVSLPFYPVPATLQPLVVMLIGMAYGARLGMLTMLAYLLEGAMGLPVFSMGRAGVAHLMGPTGGYLIGFVLAAGVVGYLAERGWDRRVSTTVAAMLLGNLMLYLPGLLVLHSVTGMNWHATLAAGLLPFVLQDVLKAIIAAGLLPGAWKLLGRRPSPATTPTSLS